MSSSSTFKEAIYFFAVGQSKKASFIFLINASLLPNRVMALRLSSFAFFAISSLSFSIVVSSIFSYIYKEFDYTSEIQAIFDAGGWPTLNSIPIDVEWVTGDVKVAARLNNKETHTYQKDENGRLVVDTNGDPIIVESSDPVVPHVIQVPIGTAWSQERVNIGLKNEGPYHLFPDYVSNHNVKFWESDVDNFYLYQGNRSPLAYSNYNPSQYYLTDIETIEDVLWNEENPV